MKKLFFLAVIIFLASTICSYKKSSSTPPLIPNQWTINSSIFKKIYSRIKGAHTLYAVEGRKNNYIFFQIQSQSNHLLNGCSKMPS